MKNTGIGFGGLLTLLFVYFKVTNAVDWQWFSLAIWEPSVFIVVTISLWAIAVFGVGFLVTVGVTALYYAVAKRSWLKLGRNKKAGK